MASPSSPHGNAEAIAVEAVDDLAEQRKARRWNVIVEIAGAIAGISTTAAFIPQVVEIYISATPPACRCQCIASSCLAW